MLYSQVRSALAITFIVSMSKTRLINVHNAHLQTFLVLQDVRCEKMIIRDNVSRFGYSELCLLFLSVSESVSFSDGLTELRNALLASSQFLIYAGSGSELY